MNIMKYALGKAQGAHKLKGWIRMNDIEKKIAERNSTPEKEAQKERKAAEALAKKIAGKEKAKPKAEPKKDKQAKPKTQKAEPKKDKQVAKPQDAAILTTKEVAAMVGTTPKALRRVLRAKWYNDGKMTHYSWTKNDPILKEILDHYKKAAK
jgi:hypothetical protein